MRISLKFKEEIVTSFKNYLKAKKTNTENVFLFFSVESFKNFLERFEPDVTGYSSVKDILKFLSEKQIGDPVVAVWNNLEDKAGEGVLYTFSPCKLIREKSEKTKKDHTSLIVCGWHEKFFLKEKK